MHIIVLLTIQVELHEDDCDDLMEIFEEADKETTKLTKKHFLKVFMEQQRQYHKLERKQRIRCEYVNYV